MRTFAISTFVMVLTILANKGIAMEVETWECTPKHWVNLRLVDGADVNPGREPEFTLTVVGKSLTTSGKDSWLDRGEFVIQNELNLGGQVFLEAVAQYGSMLVFNKTKSEFVHSGAPPSLAVSMAGDCRELLVVTPTGKFD